MNGSNKSQNVGTETTKDKKQFLIHSKNMLQQNSVIMIMFATEAVMVLLCYFSFIWGSQILNCFLLLFPTVVSLNILILIFALTC